MKILEYFPHIKNRVSKDCDEELLMYSIRYGKEFVALNIKTPRGANCTRLENGAVLFRLIDYDDEYWAGSEGIYITTVGHPIKTNVDTKGGAFIGLTSFGEFEISFNNTEYYLSNDSYNSPSMEKFNKFWKLTPYDVSFRTPLNGEYSHIKGRIVPIDKKRYSYLEKMYGNGSEFIILDINVPKDSVHVRVDEGVMFWFADASSLDSKSYYVLSSVAKDKGSIFLNKSAIIHKYHYGENYHGYSYFMPSDIVSYDDNRKVNAFNNYWKNI